MEKQVLKIIFAGAVFVAIALTACENGYGPAKGGVIQNEAMRDTTHQAPADNTAVDTTHHM